jgi:glycosyltransferase involved in cell wall biosynthesis
MSDGSARIVFLMDSYEGPKAGTERQLFELVSGLDRTRFDPMLVLLRSTPAATDPTQLPCPLHVLGVQRLASPCSWLKMAAFATMLRRIDVKLVHILFNDASIIGPPFCKLAGACTVVARRDMGFWYTPSILRLLRFNRRFVDAVAVNSEAVRLNVHRFEGYPLEHMYVLTNGHRPTRLFAAPEPGLRERLSIPPHHTLVGMVANLRAVKRHADLLRAFAVVRARQGTAHLLLVGGGELEASLRDLTAQLGLTDWVHFLGSVDDPVPLIKHCDVCVLSSASEGSSNALLEYLGCGKAIVCTNVGGNAELIRDGETGFLVEPGDVMALADRVEWLVANPALARTMGQRGHDLFTGRFTSEQMVAAHMEMYDRLLSAA